jgi:hypothetical protein
MKQSELIDRINALAETPTLLECSRRAKRRLGPRGGLLRNLLLSEKIRESLYDYIDPFSDVDCVVEQQEDWPVLASSLASSLAYAGFIAGKRRLCAVYLKVSKAIPLFRRSGSSSGFTGAHNNRELRSSLWAEIPDPSSPLNNFQSPSTMKNAIVLFGTRSWFCLDQCLRRGIIEDEHYEIGKRLRNYWDCAVSKLSGRTYNASGDGDSDMDAVTIYARLMREMNISETGKQK